MDKEEYFELLADIRCDVSQHVGWRRRLFDNPDNTTFEITPESIKDEYPLLAEKIRSSKIKFFVEKNDGHSLDSVIFKFYPSSQPQCRKISFNNPEAR